MDREPFAADSGLRESFGMADRQRRTGSTPGVASGEGQIRGPSEVLLEFHQVGSVVKVTAVDPATQVEVSIQGPATAGEATLRRTAIDKLRYVLARRQSGA